MEILPLITFGNQTNYERCHDSLDSVESIHRKLFCVLIVYTQGFFVE